MRMEAIRQARSVTPVKNKTDVKTKLKGIVLKASTISAPPVFVEPTYSHKSVDLEVVMRREPAIKVGNIDYCRCWTLYMNDEYVDHDAERHVLANRFGLKIEYPQLN